MTGKVKVVISNDQSEIRIPTGVRMLVRRCCTAVLVQEDFEGAAEVSLTDSSAISTDQPMFCRFRSAKTAFMT